MDHSTEWRLEKHGGCVGIQEKDQENRKGWGKPLISLWEQGNGVMKVVPKKRVTAFGLNKNHHKKPQTRLSIYVSVCILISIPAGYSCF